MDLRWAAAPYQVAKSASIPFLFKQVSHNLIERGINALGLYLAWSDGRSVDPATVDCVRQYPELSDSFSPPSPKGGGDKNPEFVLAMIFRENWVYRSAFR